MRSQGPDEPTAGVTALSLPYQIVDGDGVEIARAASPQLAVAMFQSALSEHPSRTLCLRRHGSLLIERFA